MQSKSMPSNNMNQKQARRFPEKYTTHIEVGKVKRSSNVASKTWSKQAIQNNETGRTQAKRELQQSDA
jgi:hypothetical protein